MISATKFIAGVGPFSRIRQISGLGTAGFDLIWLIVLADPAQVFFRPLYITTA